MGEAKRRRELQERTRPMPGDLQDDIANAARAVTMVPTEGGYCVAINQLGYVVLRSCGLEPVMAMGSLIYRVGLDPVRDVVCFSGPGGAGCMHGSTLLGHLWLEMDGDIIDFSSGDWKMTTTALCAYGPEPKLPLRYARLHALIDGYFWHSGPKNMDQLFGLGPIMPTAAASTTRCYMRKKRSVQFGFEVEPPEYVWQSAAPLKAAWKRGADPDIGEMWFGPWAGERVDVLAHDLVRLMLPATKRTIQQLRILERVAAWRRA